VDHYTMEILSRQRQRDLLAEARDLGRARRAPRRDAGRRRARPGGPTVPRAFPRLMAAILRLSLFE